LFEEEGGSKLAEWIEDDTVGMLYRVRPEKLGVTRLFRNRWLQRGEQMNEILISSSVIPNAYYLGPMGDTNPSDFINQETNQIPFRQSLVDLSSWNTKTPFRN